MSSPALHGSSIIGEPTELPSVAYLGPPSSYSHQAAQESFPQSTHIFLPQDTIAGIFKAVQSKSATYGVVPFENSTNGSVVFTLDLFCDRDEEYPLVHVCGETYLKVHHCLLAKHDASMAAIKRIYSHPQAFGQCEMWLKSTLKGVERVDVSSTSRAAQMAAEEDGAAAIASRIAATVHDLKVMARNVEDTPNNTTRFFVMSATKRCQRGDNDKTLLTFTVDHDQPGALCDSLKVFKDFGLNLTSISSRPNRKTHWNYVFFVEFEGYEGSENVKNALVELQKYCCEMRVLGSYADKQKQEKAKAKDN